MEEKKAMKNILIIGLGRFGRHCARKLNEMGHQVMAVDVREDRVDADRQQHPHGFYEDNSRPQL